MGRGVRKGLTDQERAFCVALVGEARYTISAASALVGVNNKTGRAWLDRPEVQECLEELEAVRKAESGGALLVTAERVEQEVAAIAFADLTDLLDCEGVEIVDNGEASRRLVFSVRNPKMLPAHIRRAIRKFKMVYPRNGGEPRFQCELFDKMEALKMLGVTSGLVQPRQFGGNTDPEASGARPHNGVKLAGLTLIGPTKGKLPSGDAPKLNGRAKK